jgi:hypothetical protein
MIKMMFPGKCGDYIRDFHSTRYRRLHRMRMVSIGMGGAPHITPWDACDTRQPNEGMVGHRIRW